MTPEGIFSKCKKIFLTPAIFPVSCCIGAKFTNFGPGFDVVVK